MNAPALVFVATLGASMVERLSFLLDRTEVVPYDLAASSPDGSSPVLPNGPLLGLVEHPALGLAAALSAGQVEDPGLWLRRWCDSAKRLLACAQLDPARCLLVEAEEVLREPSALVLRMESAFGSVLGLSSDEVATDQTDPLSRALAEALVFADGEVQAVYAELQASCALLSGLDPVPTPFGSAPRIDGIAAARSLRAWQERLRLAEVVAIQARADLTAMQDRAKAQDVALHQLRIELAQAQLAARQSDAEWRASCADRDLLRVRAAELQDALEESSRACALQVQVTDEAQAEVIRLRSDLALAADQYERVSSAFEQQTAALADARSELALANQERGLLLPQLQQVQEELETVFVGRREAQTQLAAAIAQRDAQGRDAAEIRLQMAAQARANELTARQLEEAQSQLEAARADKHQAAQQREQSLRDHRDQEARLVQVQQQLGEAREEGDLLLAQLHQVQEELERYFLRCRELEDAAAAPAVSDESDLSVGKVVLSGERDTPPYRELSFDLHKVRLGDRLLGDASVRLVEHHGHPGLVLFRRAEGPQLLGAWQESGQEDGRSYALLVPSDANCRPSFDALNGCDWLRLQSLSARLAAALGDATMPAAAEWRAVVRRLREQLAELPRCFRYADAVIKPAPEGSPGALTLQFQCVHSGSRYLPRLVVHWVPAGRQAGIALMKEPDHGPPLPSWPDDEQGRSPDQLWLPLGPEVDSEHKRAPWLQLALPDREFVLSMLAAWPAAVVSATARSGAGAGSPGQDLVAAARGLLPDALAALALRPEPEPRARSGTLARAARWWRRRAANGIASRP